jgi:NAD(P)-dependent dehydrogenase (short-subunit alcohol dehydrogenase family)
LKDRTFLVTGATDGLGLDLARRLVATGATVLIHGRDEQRLANAARDLGGDVRTYLADFADFDQVRAFAARLADDGARPDVLINNAGMGAGRRDDQRLEGKAGHELRFTVNHLAPFLLTRLLLPLLRPAARIVTVASAGQSPIDFDDVMLHRGYEPLRAYRQSKLAQIATCFELAERLDPAQATVNSLHPASLMGTKMVYETFGYTMSTVAEGSEATLRLALSDDLAGITGRYYDGVREARAHAQCYDPSARQRLWRLSSELVGLPAD